MRLASFMIDERESWGVVDKDCISDLGYVLGGRFATLKDYLQEPDPQCLSVEAMQHPLNSILWRPVIPNPGKILCVGLNYEDHRAETGRSKTDHPAIFTRFSDTQVGHGAAILKPRVSNSLDYEGELALVIGQRARHLKESEALKYVAGYAIYNDVSVRDWQRHTIQFTPGKNFPGTGGFGPWMVTPDELGPISDLRIETKLNGAIMQEAVLGDMIFSVPEILAYCSTFTELNPGDVIATGTPGGVGMKRNPQIFMKPGDEIVVQIEGIGALRNQISEEV